MSKPIIGLLALATIVFATKWYEVSREAALLQAQVAAPAAPTPTEPPRAAADPVATRDTNAPRPPAMPEEQQAAYLLAAMQTAADANALTAAQSRITMLERQLARSESAIKRAQKERGEQANGRQALLRERQAVLDAARDEVTRLQVLNAELVEQLRQYQLKEDLARRRRR